MKKNITHRNNKNLKQELRKTKQKEKSLPNTNFKNQNSFKIKLRERRPRKGRLGGVRAAFATLSRVPSKKK
jgi:hypothetical protein